MRPRLALPSVSTLHKNLSIPVCCKIRLLPKLEDTIKLALVLQNAGCQVLAVHGRTRESNSRGPADWAAIRQIKEALSIPVVANGGVDELEDVERCLNETKADAVMVAYPALLNPRFFGGGEKADGVELLHEYLSYVERYPAQSKTIKSHARKLLKPMWGKHKDLREQLEAWDERDQAIASVVLRIAQELKYRIDNGIEVDLKPPEAELEEGDGYALFGPQADDDY
ncbi:tdiRNAhydrouridine synthase [Acanthamoeba castellanii str. Neff]|uniref:TdiRNAhydrouridine synthase n=1 Tax=Acanthamoeba castellanii (strain ATCC 30010 / Neff) TaxID=1257118 RepID=L8GXV3_ACACF|nr:tdiRNAhydrouridine synthase [Acanthamoeba castellanii str. Neff]ELR18074.1 tdiRNAhydrouridine synthase [Acanthamoeba castellanii str. Neff]